MAPSQNGHTNGINGHSENDTLPSFVRFQDIPSVIDIPVRGEEGDEAVNLDLTELHDDIDELCDLLENENAAKAYWVTIALAYAKQNKIDVAIEIVKKALSALARAKPEDKLSLLTVLCWLQLWKARHAPRVPPESASQDVKVKDTWLQAATGTLNDASRINPSYPPLHLARGVLQLLKAPLLSGRTGAGSTHEALVQASKGFEDALRNAKGNNVMALLGKARTTYSLGRYPEALQMYQKAMEASPDLIEPDPRIGIGCCLWQLNHKDYAHQAWERALELNPKSGIAHQLIAMYYLDKAGHHSTSDEAFTDLYKKAMTIHTQASFKIDDMQPLTCATFGNYFLLRKNWPTVDKLAKRAVEITDLATIASDGWYLRARQAHYQNDHAMAADCYSKSDSARGGEDKGYNPAKFGVAQLRTLARDYDGAKFRLEKLLSQSKSIEVQTLLGMLYAEEVFSANPSEKVVERKKAITHLEHVRTSWRDVKRKTEPDSAVLLSLARLYENEAPDRALACLLQVEQLELDGIGEEDRPEGIDDAEEERKAMRELISPQLLNNIGCFQFQAEKYSLAREYFQTALSACVKRADEANDTDALVTTISYNLARVYEAEGLDTEAHNVYASLLQRHPDYTDASLRLSYLAVNADPANGASSIKALLEADPANLEVRSMFGWYIHKAKKRTLAINEDQEQRHYKQTLQTYDKHDLYSLTGMGNLHLAVAREMPRQTDQDKEKKSKVYMRAVEFFDKVLTLDSKNAYAAQGMAIALVEDKKDKTSGVQIFSKVRETIKDATVYINLGHVFADVGQFARSIENYEAALMKMKSTDPQQANLLACLGRVWLLRGRAEGEDKRLESFKTSLTYSQRALEAAAGAKDEINYRFNVAFVQIQIAQLMNILKDAMRSTAEVQTAIEGLDQAIEAFTEIAASPNPPFPRNDIEQRANMGRNTMKRQLATTMDKQQEYERKNHTRLEEARRLREEDIARREEAKRKAEEIAEQERRRLHAEREEIKAQDMILMRERIEAAQRAKEEADEREAAAWTTDEETGERKKRAKRKTGDKKKRKKKADDSDEDDGIVGDSDDEGSRRHNRSSATPDKDGEEPARKKKKRRLERKSAAAAAKPGKYKSSEMVEDSSEDEGAPPTADTPDAMMSDDEDTTARAKVRRPARVVDDDDEDDEPAANGGVPADDEE
ncbi:hypothetical protein MRB53_039910 [Persea americana]|nr:hypothetical protein MRB53_039910 [Persea americana]